MENPKPFLTSLFNATAQPSNNVPIANVPEQRQIIGVPKPVADILQNLVEQYTSDNSKTNTIKDLKEKNEELEIILHEYLDRNKRLEDHFRMEKGLLENRLTEMLRKNNERAAKIKEHQRDLNLLERQWSDERQKTTEAITNLKRQLSDERQKVTEATYNLEELDKLYKEIKAKLEQCEKEIIKLRKNAAATAAVTVTIANQQPINTDIYPLDQIDPLVTAGSWRSIYDDLHDIVVEELDKQSPNSVALEQYQKLTYYTPDHPCGSTYSRHYAYAIVREMSSILCKISRRIVLKEDDTFEYTENDDLVSSLMEYVMVTSNRRDFAERILGFLASPNNIDAASDPIFEKLPGGPKAFFEHMFEHLIRSLHQTVTYYGISTDTMDASFKRVIYSAIYTTLRTTVIRDDFVSFWSNVTWDCRILNLPCGDKKLVHYRDVFNNKLETVPLPLIPEDPQVAFTVFPGFLYVNDLREIKVIERSQVVCCKKS